MVERFCAAIHSVIYVYFLNMNCLSMMYLFYDISLTKICCRVLLIEASMIVF